MVRSLMQVYTPGSADAVALYERAFDTHAKNVYKNPDGSIMHSELDICGQILAVSEGNGEAPGDNMEFCLHFSADEKRYMERAYAALCPGARVLHPLGECFYSPCMAGL